MKFRKLMALLIVFIMLFSLGLVVEGDESVEIVTPANGSVFEYSEDETELVISANAGMILQIYLDGERLPDTEVTSGETEINLGVLQLGEHKAKVIAILGAASYTAESIFKVVYTVTNEEFSDNFTAGNSKVLSPYSQKQPLGKDENGDDIPAVYGSYDGIDGDENGSIGFRYMKTAAEITLDSRAEICHVMEPLEVYNLNYKFALEYDLYLLKASAWEIRSGVRGADGNNKYSELAGSKFLGDDGKVSGTDYEYPVGEWMHIKHDVNVSEGTTSLYIDGELVKENINVGTANLTGLVVFKFQYYATKPEGPQGYNLDNVRITSEAMYGGIFAEKYVLEDGTEKSIPDDLVITEETKNIIFKNDVEGFAPWEKGTKISVFADGVEIPVNSIKEKGESAFSVELSKPLPEKAHVEVYAEYNSLPMKAFFDTNAIDFGIYDVTFRQGTTDIYSTEQIDRGERLNCRLTVRNIFNDDETVLVVIGIYSGTRLVSLNTKEIEIFGRTQRDRENVYVNIPQGIKDVSVEVFFNQYYQGKKANVVPICS